MLASVGEGVTEGPRPVGDEQNASAVDGLVPFSAMEPREKRPQPKQNKLALKPAEAEEPAVKKIQAGPRSDLQQRLDVLSKVQQGEIKQAAAARVLGVTPSAVNQALKPDNMKRLREAVARGDVGAKRAVIRCPHLSAVRLDSIFETWLWPVRGRSRL